MARELNREATQQAQPTTPPPGELNAGLPAGRGSNGGGIPLPDRSEEFNAVLHAELLQIDARRLGGDLIPPSVVPPVREVLNQASKRSLVGLAFSGGGIRSATFNLGVLQGLADLGLLRCFDYLSTVSGGGYIGGWFAAWVKREGELANVEQQLRPSRVDQAQATRPGLDRGTPTESEPQPIWHLRSYSNYLSPQLGLFSADIWVLWSIYLRNFLLNQLVLLPALVVVILAARLLTSLFDPAVVSPNKAGPYVAGVLLLALAVAFWRIALAQHRLDVVRTGGDPGRASLRTELGRFWTWTVGPLFLAAVLASWLLREKEWVQEIGLLVHLPSWWPAPLAFALFFGFFHGLAYPLVEKPFADKSWVRRPEKGAPAAASAGASRMDNRGKAFWWHAFGGALSGFVGGLLLYALAVGFLQKVPIAFVVCFGPPLALMVFVLSVVVEVGLLGRSLEEDNQEWWASLSGWVLIHAAVWLSVFSVVLFSGWLVTWLYQKAGTGAWAGALGTWLLTTGAGVLAGHSPRTSTGKGNKAFEVIALVAPHVFIAGLLILVSFLVELAAEWFRSSWTLSPPVLACSLAGVVVAGSLFVLFVAWRVDVNVFSLYALYGNRLVRCYLGASRPKRARDLEDPGDSGGTPANSAKPERRPNAITGFDPKDDLPLACFALRTDRHESEQPYRGPYLLINTALNLTAGSELAWQERKAESFVLTPLYCGSKSTGYRPLPAYADNLLLGDAITLSGAAVSPNMGYHSSPAVTALLTVFNARLGGWLGNPRKKRTWDRSSPGWGLLYLLWELFGRTDAHSPYVYLSDGGHFENLGVYELVRRRCRFIVCCDAEADPHYVFDALGGVLRKCRNDFGVRIELDVTPVRPQGTDGLSRWHCAVGKIRYDDVDPTATPGTLVYLKASLTGDEPSDLRQYATGHPTFPHQTTLNQFFTESQFESYRMLGYHVALEVFHEALRDLPPRAAADPSRNTEALFASLHRRWFPPPPGLEASFLESVKEFSALQRDLRRDPQLREFSKELFPELPPLPAAGAAGSPAPAATASPDRIPELAVLSQMLQIMENAWLGVHLDGYAAHPMNRGWMNVFRRWTNSRFFRAYWPILRGAYSQDFVRFCETELRLTPGVIEAVPIDPNAAVVQTALIGLNREFAWEWPDQDDLFDILKDVVSADEKPQLPRPLCWLAALREPDKKGKPWAADEIACGVLLVAKPAGKKGPFQLVIWLRGAYRNLRIGRECYQQVQDQIQQALQKIGPAPVTLQVCLPGAGQKGNVGKLQKAMWLNFYSSYGFHKVLPSSGQPEKNLTLEQVLTAATTPAAAAP
jgi:hypothetical protein